MRAFVRKSFFVVASALTFSLLFTSMVYVCSKFAPMGMLLQLSSMGGMGGFDGGGVERGPCEQDKQDVCKSVRDRMLSIQAAVFRTEASKQFVVLTLPPLVESVDRVVSRPVPFHLEIYHPVFKLSLPFVFLNLRI